MFPNATVTLESNGIPVPEPEVSIEINIKTRVGLPTSQPDLSPPPSAAPERIRLTKPGEPSLTKWDKSVDKVRKEKLTRFEKTKLD